MLALLRRWGASALVQRLGHFLDLHQGEVPAEARAGLLGRVRPGNKIQLGPAGSGARPAGLPAAFSAVRDLVVVEYAAGGLHLAEAHYRE